MLSLTEYSLGNYADAKELYERTLSIKKFHYQDPSHLRLASATDGLGLAEEALGNYTIALELRKRAYNIQHKNYKERLRSILAHTCLPPSIPWPKLSQINRNEAIQHYKDSLEITRKIYGEHHHLLARYYYMLGQAYEVNSQINQAIFRYKQSLAIAQQVTKGLKNDVLRTKHRKNVAMVESRLAHILPLSKNSAA